MRRSYAFFRQTHAQCCKKAVGTHKGNEPSACRPPSCFGWVYENGFGVQYEIAGGSSFACAIIFSTSLREGTRLHRPCSSLTATSLGWRLAGTRWANSFTVYTGGFQQFGELPCHTFDAEQVGMVCPFQDEFGTDSRFVGKLGASARCGAHGEQVVGGFYSGLFEFPCI